MLSSTKAMSILLTKVTFNVFSNETRLTFSVLLIRQTFSRVHVQALLKERRQETF